MIIIGLAIVAAAFTIFGISIGICLTLWYYNLDKENDKVTGI